MLPDTVNQQLLHFLTLRRGAAVATASIEAVLDEFVLDPQVYVSLSKQRLALEAAQLQYQTSFLEKLESLSLEERAHVVFDLLDQDFSGTVGLSELVVTLQLMNGEDSVDNVLPLAVQAIKSFDQDKNGELDKNDFVPFLATLSNIMECTQCELCQYICTVVTFQPETGQRILQDAVCNLIDDEHLSRESFDDACIEARLVLIFSNV